MLRRERGLVALRTLVLGKRRWLFPMKSSSGAGLFSSSSFTSESNKDVEEKRKEFVKERTEEAEEMLDRKQRELLEEEISAEEYGENPETRNEASALGSESVFFERRRDRVGGSRRHGEETHRTTPTPKNERAGKSSEGIERRSEGFRAQSVRVARRRGGLRREVLSRRRHPARRRLNSHHEMETLRVEDWRTV